MPVFAMTREMGSLGKDVALALADTLGLEIIHHELVERHLADRLNLGESAVHRFLEGRPSMLERWKIDQNRLSRFTAEEILELASKGNVIIRGWGAAQLLTDVSHVICVRVCAPMAKRVAEMRKRLNIGDDATVQGEIDLNDNAHSRAIQRQFGKDWQNALHYDIVLNTGRVSVDDCIAQLRRLADSTTYEVTEKSRIRLHDKLVEARARSILDSNLVDMPYGSGLSVGVTEGVVTLSGLVAGSQDLTAVIGQIKSVKGVTKVENKVMAVRQSFGV